VRGGNSRPRSGSILLLRGGGKPGRPSESTFGKGQPGRGCLQWRLTQRFDGLFLLGGRAGGGGAGFRIEPGYNFQDVRYSVPPGYVHSKERSGRSSDRSFRSSTRS
jgi:hypothetical protein